MHSVRPATKRVFYRTVGPGVEFGFSSVPNSDVEVCFTLRDSRRIERNSLPKFKHFRNVTERPGSQPENTAELKKSDVKSSNLQTGSTNGHEYSSSKLPFVKPKNMANEPAETHPFEEPQAERSQPEPLQLSKTHRSIPSSKQVKIRKNNSASFRTSHYQLNGKVQNGKKELSSVGYPLHSRDPSLQLGEPFSNQDTIYESSLHSAVSSRKPKSHLKAHNLGVSYSRINFCQVGSDYGLLMTQAREEKSKRSHVKRKGQEREQDETLEMNPSLHQSNQGGVGLSRGVIIRLKMVKQFVKEYLDNQQEGGGGQKHKNEIVTIHLVVSKSQTDFICLEKSFSLLKLLESYVMLYQVYFERSAPESTSLENDYRLFERIQGYLKKIQESNLEIRLTEEETFQQFAQLEPERRPFLENKYFQKIRGIDAIATSYMFLEYKPEVLEPQNLYAYLSRVGKDLEEPSEKDESVEESGADQPLDSEEMEAQLLERKNKEIEENIKKMRAETLKNRQGLHELGDKVIYNSELLRRIDVCLKNKEILFDIDSDTFNKMVDMEGMPEKPKPDKNSTEDMIHKHNVYFDLVNMRDFMNNQCHEMGNDLQNKLNLIDYRYKRVEKDENSIQDPEPLEQPELSYQPSEESMTSPKQL